MNKAHILILVSVFFCLEISAEVTLTESKIQWKTFKHTVNSDYSLLNDTFSSEIVTHTYNSLVMENEYLKVTLVPEYGGRIISMIYKPSGHEQLYQNPVGRPYGPPWESFYYDWLMVWGGIFPTFSEPEHGKAWCRPWSYEITSNTAEKVSVKMSFTDNINFQKRPPRFKYGATNITCHFEVILESQNSALKTSVTLENPNNSSIPYEYWTNVGLSPGSVPGNTRCDDQTEIIGPVSNVKISNDWPDIQKADTKVSNNLYRFKNLRYYKNWTKDGIAYAWPVEGNFWGALNHGNNEAIIRISENVKTPGLKIWGFGYNQSKGFNPETNLDYRRPFIELWAGVSNEFFTPAQFPAKSTVQFDEFYTPVIGMTEFTHASEHAMINLATDKASYNGNSDKKVVVSCQYFVTKPAEQVLLNLSFKGSSNKVTVYELTRNHDKNGPFQIKDTVAVQDLCNDIDSLVFELRSGNKSLMSSRIPVTFTNAGSCATSLKQSMAGQKYLKSFNGAQVNRKIYNINGACIGVDAHPTSKYGIFLTVDNQGRCNRFVKLGR